MSNRRLPIVAMLLSTSLAALAMADAPTTRPVPLRTVTVNGEGRTLYATGNENDMKRADLASYEAALADAKDRAARAAKVLGVTLGPPVTVEGTYAAGGPNDDGRGSNYSTTVKIVFELREP